MSKWNAKSYAQRSEPPAVEPPKPVLPPGRWMNMRATRENGVSGWVLDELIPNEDGTFRVKRIHGPDLFDIVAFKHEQERAR